MGLSVIGAGFGRTGTLSLKGALEDLGFGPCHHMKEVFDNPAQLPHWQRAAVGEAVDWEAVDWEAVQGPAWGLREPWSAYTLRGPAPSPSSG